MPINSLSGTTLNSRKRVLVVLYSQTGQLSAIADSILAPLRTDPRVDIHVEVLKPLTPYPYPWPFFRFLDVFPESAHLISPPLASLTLTGDEDFDLIILPYQVWYLAPSLPVTAFLKHPVAARLLKGKPVITVIACRNMWFMAQEKMKTLLAAIEARLLDNIALTDPSPILATLITTPRWLWTGRREAFWGLPAAGIPQSSITECRRFGLALCEALRHNAERANDPLLSGLNAVNADSRLYLSEKAGTRSFYIWGLLLRAAGQPGSWQRVPLLVLYVCFLITLIIMVVPVSLTLQTLLRPLFKARLSQLKHVFEQPSGSGTERMSLHE